MTARTATTATPGWAIQPATKPSATAPAARSARDAGIFRAVGTRRGASGRGAIWRPGLSAGYQRVQPLLLSLDIRCADAVAAYALTQSGTPDGAGRSVNAVIADLDPVAE